MTEAPPPSDLPFASEDLRSNGERPSDADQAFYDKAMQDKENGALSLAPDKGRDMAATMAAMDRVNGVPPTPTLVPVVGRVEASDPISDAIEAEVKKIEALTPVGASAPAPEKPSEPAYGSAEYFAQRNASDAEGRRKFSLNPLTRAGNLVSGVTRKITDGMAKMGEGIENAEYERAVDKQLASRNAAEVYSDHMNAFGNAAPAPVSTEQVPRQEVAQVPAREEKAPLRPFTLKTPEIPPPSGPVERKAREYWGVSEGSSWNAESSEDPMLLAEEIRLQEEQLAIQQAELDIKRRKLLLQRKKDIFAAKVGKGKNPPPMGGGAAQRVA